MSAEAGSRNQHDKMWTFVSTVGVDKVIQNGEMMVHQTKLFPATAGSCFLENKRKTLLFTPDSVTNTR